MIRIFKHIAAAVTVAAFSLSMAAQVKTDGKSTDIDGVVRFDKTIHDFGDVTLGQGALNCAFTATNISDKPIVIYNVVSSCGCTGVKWTREPVLPGKSGKISATYSNDEGPYPFDKTLTVYISNVKKPIVLRPGSVEENWEEEVEKVKECAVNHNVIAIGEIGLDYHYSKDSAELQRRALKAQFELAAELDLPVNIHERDATEDFFRVLEECRHLGVRGNMHAFSGSYETFMRLQKYGDWSVGIGGVVTFKNAGVAESVKKIPLEKILLETDSPYLTPMPFRGKRNESSYIPLIARKVAELKNTDLGEVAAKTTENACKLFRISI